MAREFKIVISRNGMQSIEANDMTAREMTLLRWVVTNNLMTHPDYKQKKGVDPFLQGEQAPHEGRADGWILVEFWSFDQPAIERYVAYVNAQFRNAKRLAACG